MSTDARMRAAMDAANARHDAGERLRSAPIVELTDAEIETLASCRHPELSVPRRRITKTKATQWRTQCLVCGSAVGQAVAAAKLPMASFGKDFDEKIAERQIEAAWERQRRWEAAHPAPVYETREERRQRYAEYLRTPGWRALRERVMKRDAWTCKACGMARATEVHHKTYDHVDLNAPGTEPLFDLEAICEGCHRTLTARERG